MAALETGENQKMKQDEEVKINLFMPSAQRTPH